MPDSNTNRFFYATLIDLGFDPANPEILLEVGLEKPVDWDAVDDGSVICRRLDFVLTVDHAKVAGEPVRIHFTYERVVKEHGLHGDAYVYVLGLRPTRDKLGRECDRIALETAVGESKNLRGRSWCADIGEVRISWRHAPESVIILPNGAFLPEEPAQAVPPATEDEIQRAFDGLDAFFDEVDPYASAIIPLDERDIEFIHDWAAPVLEFSISAA